MFQCHLKKPLTFTTNVLCDWDFSGCGSVRQGCIEVSSPIIYNSNSATIRIGEEYDTDDLWVVLKPVDKTQALEAEYEDIIFDLATMSVEIEDDLTRISEIVETVDGFTWEQWINHPGYISPFRYVPQGYVVDDNGDTVLCYNKIDQTSHEVRKNELVLSSAEAYYAYNFDKG